MTHPLSRRTALLGAAATAALTAAGCSPAQQSSAASSSAAPVTVTVRLWDDQVQKAYDAGFAEFSKANPNITVKTTLVPWADYFTKLRTDAAAGNADDLFLMNGSYIQPYVTGNLISEIGSDYADLRGGWSQAAIDQYTFSGKLYGVPQLTDGGIALYYNKDLLAAAGVSPDDLKSLTWAPGGGAGDTLLPLLKKLTKDANGKRADEAGFDGSKPAVWGYNASQDLQAIYYNFIGSNGGQFQDSTGTFVFASDQSVAAFQYIVDLINTHKVAPAASNTNANGDFARDQFLQGKIAIFQSGVYNLKNVADGAKFAWGIAPLPAGPAGPVSVVNTIVIAGNAKSKNPDAAKKVLRWLGSDGAAYIGKAGAALPAVTAQQQSFTDFWKAKSVDPTQFAKQGELKTLPAPSGANYGAAFSAWKPIFDEIFLGRTPVAEGLAKAQDAANKALNS